MRIKRSYKKPNSRKRKPLRLLLLPLVVLSIAAAGIFFLIRLDMTLFPAALQAAEVLAKARMNEIINYGAISAIERHNLVSEDFFSVTVDDEGRLNALSVNTILINHLTNELAVSMSRELTKLNTERVEIPYGALTGIRAIANLGPGYTVYLMPIGEVVVDYSSSFSSVGINQINFQVWLNVNTRMSIINPLQSSDVVLERRIPLVNTVINADIPNVYLGSPPDGIIISPPS